MHFVFFPDSFFKIQVMNFDLYTLARQILIWGFRGPVRLLTQNTYLTKEDFELLGPSLTPYFFYGLHLHHAFVLLTVCRPGGKL